MLTPEEPVEVLRRAWKVYQGGKPRDALDLCLPLAEQGDVECQAFVGAIFARGGRGVEQNDEEAKRWLEQAAAARSANALYSLGVICHRADDYARARDYYQRAADLGYSAAYYQLARMYYYGIGVDKDRDRAFYFYTEGARRGHIFARREAAVMLLRGYRGLHYIPVGLIWFLRSLGSGLRTIFREPYGERTFY